jgi:hypothetical protein
MKNPRTKSLYGYGKGWADLYSLLTYHKCFGYPDRDKLMGMLREDVDWEIAQAVEAEQARLREDF